MSSVPSLSPSTMVPTGQNQNLSASSWNGHDVTVMATPDPAFLELLDAAMDGQIPPVLRDIIANYSPELEHIIETVRNDPSKFTPSVQEKIESTKGYDFTPRELISIFNALKARGEQNEKLLKALKKVIKNIEKRTSDLCAVEDLVDIMIAHEKFNVDHIYLCLLLSQIGRASCSKR